MRTFQKKKATERIELSTPGLRDLCSATELSGRRAARSYPSGHGAGLEIQWALPAQVRTLPIANFRRGNMYRREGGIEPLRVTPPTGLKPATSTS